MLLFHHGGDNMGRLANLSSESSVDACSMGCDLFSAGTVGSCVSASFLTSVLQSWQRGVWDQSVSYMYTMVNSATPLLLHV